jgi:hypothetical protein
MKPAHWALVIVVFWTANVSVAKDECAGLKSIQDRLVGTSQAQGKADAPCGSLRSVLDRLANWNKTGGRKLEEAKPFNQAAAQANLDKALSDAGISRRFNQLKLEVANDKERMVYEAAILDDEGYYDARDLRIRQLQQLLH